MCVWMCAWVCICVSVYVCICEWCVYMYMSLCMFVCQCICIYICVYVCVSVYMLMLLEGIEIRRQCSRFGSFFPPMCVLWGSTCQAGWQVPFPAELSHWLWDPALGGYIFTLALLVLWFFQLPWGKLLGSAMYSVPYHTGPETMTPSNCRSTPLEPWVKANLPSFIWVPGVLTGWKAD